LDAEWGRWIHAPDDVQPVLLTGGPADVLGRLKQGWNLISVPCDINFSDLGPVRHGARVWDAAEQHLVRVSGGGILEAGRGYWVFAEAEGLAPFSPRRD